MKVDHKDLDETRRLLYMVMFEGLKTERWHNLAGTLVNALAHHNLMLDPSDVMASLWKIRDADDYVAAAKEWALPLIDQLNERAKPTT